MRTPFSFVLQTPPAPADAALRHFAGKLALETDPSDVHTDLERGKDGFVVVDARTPAAFAEAHVPGALNLPARAIDAAAVEILRGKTVVVYCWNAACNAAAKAAVKLAAEGLQVKEMIGGLEAWVHEGHPVEGTLPPEVSFEEYLRRHHTGRPQGGAATTAPPSR